MRLRRPAPSEDGGDALTLGLLVELRDLCQKVAYENEGFAIEVHRLLQQLTNPNLHGLDSELHFRVLPDNTIDKVGLMHHRPRTMWIDRRKLTHVRTLLLGSHLG